MPTVHTPETLVALLEQCASLPPDALEAMTGHPALDALRARISAWQQTQAVPVKVGDRVTPTNVHALPFETEVEFPVAGMGRRKAERVGPNEWRARSETYTDDEIANGRPAAVITYLPVRS